MKLVQLIIIISLPFQDIFGQAIISGTVHNKDGEPIVGVNVYIRGTYDGSATNLDGLFSFESGEMGTQNIVASCIGYKLFQIEIEMESGSQALAIVLEEEINKIDGITISAGAFEASDTKKSVVLKTFDIVTTAGATADITGVMNTLPGTQTVGEEGRLFVRGGAGHEAKTFINGLFVAQPYGTTANNIPTRFRFPPFLFKGAFFSTGGYSAEFGQALSSVLQLNTHDLPERSQTDISLMSVGADISQTIRKNNTSLYGQIQYTNLNPYFVLVPQEYDWDRAPNSFNSTIHFKQKFDDGGDIQAYTNYDRSRMIINQPLPGNIYEQSKFDIASQNLYANLAINKPLRESASYRGGVSYSKNTNHVVMDKYQLKSNVDAIHTKLVFDHDVSEKVLLKYGGEWIYDQYDELNFYDENDQVQNFSYGHHLISPFAETTVFFSNNFVARIGARYEYMNLVNSSKVSPRASIAYKFDANSQLSMAYGKFSQLPIREYLKLSTNLNPEQATHYILNYQYTKDRRIFRLEVYYKNYDQLVTKRLTENQTFQLANSGYGDAKGVELFWRDGNSFENVDYWISYSYLDTERLYDIFPYAVMPYYASNHNFSAVYKQFITSIKSQVGFTYSYASGRPYTDPNTRQLNGKRTKSYNDLSINYSYLMKSNMILHASLSNIFGFENIFGYQYNSESNEQGIYESIPIQQQAKRFLFLGFFITISKDKNANQLNNF